MVRAAAADRLRRSTSGSYQALEDLIKGETDAIQRFDECYGPVPGTGCSTRGHRAGCAPGGCRPGAGSRTCPPGTPAMGPASAEGRRMSRSANRQPFG